MATEEIRLGRRYLLEARIARGGMGSVWRAMDEVLARTVAVKVLNSNLSDDEDFIERFRREAYAAARLTHPNIVAIYDTGHDSTQDGSDSHYIVMEYCSRGALDALLRSEGSLEPAKALAIASTVCAALGYAHRAGVIHRDVKPANVLIAADGSLKVADFGIAKAAFASGDITTTGIILGTVTHISPEQARGEDPDARSDLYATGVLLYELLVGRPPFAAETEIGTAMQHLHDDPLPPRGIKAGIPRQVEAVVLKALEKDPDDRYSSADEMRAAIDSARRAWGSDAGAVVDDHATQQWSTARGSREPDAGVTDSTPPGRVASGATAGATDAPIGTGLHAPRGRATVTPEAARSRRWVGAVIFGALLLAAIAGVGALLTLGDESNSDRGGGRGGDGPGRGGGGPGTLSVQAVSDLDPYGDEEEHSDEVALAADNDPATEWSTESYNDSLELLGKPGVGLVFDLGTSRTVERVELASNDPGYSVELKRSDTQARDDTEYDIVDDVSGAPELTSFDFEPADGRYWLVWITQLPGGGGGSASISEVNFFGS